MSDKPPAHPPHQPVHPGRGKVAPDKHHHQSEQHARAMKRPPETLHLAKHVLLPHHKGGKP